MNQAIIDLKNELRQEIKAAREAVERDLRAEIRTLRTDFHEETHSMDHMNSVFEGMRTEFAAMKSENEALKKHNSALREELDGLQKRLADAESRLQHSEQYSRRNNIEIKGIEETKGENVTAIVCKLGELSHEPITADDIETCHRVPAKNKPSCIVVQFARRQKRDALLEKAKKLRLKNTDFGLASSSPVFVNAHLCPALKRLLGMAVSKKHACSWKYVWSHNGKIYAKKHDASETVVIRQEKDLEKIC